MNEPDGLTLWQWTQGIRILNSLDWQGAIGRTDRTNRTSRFSETRQTAWIDLNKILSVLSLSSIPLLSSEFIMRFPWQGTRNVS
jgi:hypothetical protein